MRVAGVEIGNNDLCVLAADVWKSAAGTRRIDIVIIIGAAHLYDADGKEGGYSMGSRLVGKVALISGAARGMGSTEAGLLVEEGRKLYWETSSTKKASSSPTASTREQLPSAQFTHIST